MDATEEMGDPRSGQKRHRQRQTYPPGDHPKRRYLAGGRTSQKTSVPARRTWRQGEAKRHQTQANLVQDLTNQCRTPSMPLASPNQPPTGPIWEPTARTK